MIEPIPPEKIDELLRFLPAFQQPGRTYLEWRGGETLADGSLTLPYPVYPEDVEEFFRLAAQPCWRDYGYKPEQARQMVNDEDFVRKASLDEIRTMLTYCVRGERFCDGHWGAVLESGAVVKILQRLAAIRNEF